MKKINIGRLVEAVRKGQLKLEAIKDETIKKIVKRATE